MTDILLGILAVLVGAFLCICGQWVLRVVIPIWGGFAGFVFGAGLVAGIGEDRFLGTVTGWALGLVFAVVFGVLAYLFYAVGVVIATAAIGFTLGSGLVAALGIDWNWIAVVIGALFGAVFGLLAVVADVPTLVLIGLSAAAGALVVVTGLMLISGAVDSADFTRSSTTSQLQDDWWWWLTFLVLTVAGALVQARMVASVRGVMRYDAATLGH